MNHSNSIRESASGEKVFLGKNGVEFTDKIVENIKLDLEKGKRMTQREMGILIAAEERAIIEEYFSLFDNLNAESAKFLVELGLSHLVENYPESFRDKFRGRIHTLVKESYGAAA